MMRFFAGRHLGLSSGWDGMPQPAVIQEPDQMCGDGVSGVRYVRDGADGPDAVGHFEFPG